MVLVQRRNGVEEPALIWHSLSRGHKAPIGIAVFFEYLLVEFLNEDRANRRAWAGARLQVPIPRAIDFAFPNCHHHFFGQPDGNNLFLWT